MMFILALHPCVRLLVHGFICLQKRRRIQAAMLATHLFGTPAVEGSETVRQILGFIYQTSIKHTNKYKKTGTDGSCINRN